MRLLRFVAAMSGRCDILLPFYDGERLPFRHISTKLNDRQRKEQNHHAKKTEGDRPVSLAAAFKFLGCQFYHRRSPNCGKAQQAFNQQDRENQEQIPDRKRKKLHFLLARSTKRCAIAWQNTP